MYTYLFHDNITKNKKKTNEWLFGPLHQGRGYALADPAMQGEGRRVKGPFGTGKKDKSNNKHNFTNDVVGAGAHTVYSAVGRNWSCAPYVSRICMPY